MITIAGRNRAVLGLLTAAVVLGIPAFAQAQLFPNMTIHRRRPSCLQEDPIFRRYRQEFYGYYPTLWRRFPPNWQMTSPDAPTATEMEEARKAIQKEIDNPAPANGGVNDDQGENPVNPPDDQNKMGNPPVLPLPRDTSPFDTETKPPADPGAMPNDNLGAPPTQPAPEPESPPARDRAPAPRPGDRPTAETVPSLESDLGPPALPPADTGGGPSARLAPDTDASPAPPLGAAPDAVVVTPRTTPARRSTLIGGLIDNMRGRRRR